MNKFVHSVLAKTCSNLTFPCLDKHGGSEINPGRVANRCRKMRCHNARSAGDIQGIVCGRCIGYAKE